MALNMPPFVSNIHAVLGVQNHQGSGERFAEWKQLTFVREWICNLFLIITASCPKSQLEYGLQHRYIMQALGYSQLEHIMIPIGVFERWVLSWKAIYYTRTEDAADCLYLVSYFIWIRSHGYYVWLNSLTCWISHPVLADHSLPIIRSLPLYSLAGIQQYMNIHPRSSCCWFIIRLIIAESTVYLPSKPALAHLFLFLYLPHLTTDFPSSHFTLHLHHPPLFTFSNFFSSITAALQGLLIRPCTQHRTFITGLYYYTLFATTAQREPRRLHVYLTATAECITRLVRSTINLFFFSKKNFSCLSS